MMMDLEHKKNLTSSIHAESASETRCLVCSALHYSLPASLAAACCLLLKNSIVQAEFGSRNIDHTFTVSGFK